MSSLKINGKIDKPFQRGDSRDCVVLSEIYSMSQTAEGAKIIKNSIKKSR